MTNTSILVPANRVFVDTGGWIAFIDAGDKYHESVTDFLRQGAGSMFLVTTDMVVFETLTYLNRSLKSHALASDFYRSIQVTDALELVSLEADSVEAALASYFFKFADKRLSVVDAISFAVMERLGIRTALAVDRHFKEVGFELAVSVGSSG